MIAFKFMRFPDVGMHFTEPAFARAETQHPGMQAILFPLLPHYSSFLNIFSVI